MTGDLTRDAFLGGRLMLWQPAVGYRPGVDAVFLAAAVPARAGQTVLELGCGSGTVSLCLAHRVGDLTAMGVERLPEVAALARRNAEETGLPLSVVDADIAALPPQVQQRQFDHVVFNPPYFDRRESVASQNEQREASMGEATPLSLWVDVAARRLAPGGWMTAIHRPERLTDVLVALSGRLGSVCVQPLQPRVGRDASLVLVRARKDGRAPLRLHAPVVIHEGQRHMGEGDDYTPPIVDVLRRGAAFPGFGD